MIFQPARKPVWPVLERRPPASLAPLPTKGLFRGAPALVEQDNTTTGATANARVGLELKIKFNALSSLLINMPNVLKFVHNFVSNLFFFKLSNSTEQQQLHL